MVTHNTKIAQSAQRLIEIRDGSIARNEIQSSPLEPKDIKW